MPIYSEKDIISIKGGNVHPVLTYNASVRPNSASSRVLQRETDPLSKLKRRFYKNSNKPLGCNKAANGKLKTDYYSKRKNTAIKELCMKLNTENHSKLQKS